jgi:putative spermidine/putrescine transport system ATP-binding protein
MPVAEPQIELIGVRKVFGATDSVVAVDGADLTVADGELFAILGPSGSGKTTILRLIAASNSRPRASSTSAVGT